MNSKEFDELVKTVREKQDTIMKFKGADYADGTGLGDDRLANFKLVSLLLDGAPVDPVTACAVYWLKHVISICRTVRERGIGSEPLSGRFDDEANYNVLLRAAVQEVNPELFRTVNIPAYSLPNNAAPPAPPFVIERPF